MKTIIFLLTALLTSSLVSGQYVDSLEVFEVEGNTIVEIEGRNPSTGEYMSNIETNVTGSEINIDLFFVRCAGLAVITPYDTTVNLGQLPANEYLINCTTYLDINIDSSYCFQTDEIIPLDSVSTNYIVLGVEDHEIVQNELKIYPNPFSETVTIEMESLNGKCLLVITDSMGRIITRVESNSPKAKVDLSAVKPGAYILKAVIPDGQVLSKRIIKIGN